MRSVVPGHYARHREATTRRRWCRKTSDGGAHSSSTWRRNTLPVTSFAPGRSTCPRRTGRGRRALQRRTMSLSQLFTRSPGSVRVRRTAPTRPLWTFPRTDRRPLPSRIPPRRASSNTGQPAIGRPRCPRPGQEMSPIRLPRSSRAFLSLTRGRHHARRAVERARTIRNKARELRPRSAASRRVPGVRPRDLGQPGTPAAPAAAPVLLRSATLRARGAAEETST